MKVVDRKPIPIYEVVCPECKSVIHYKKSEVCFTGYIYCPICSIEIWANTAKPVCYIDKLPPIEEGNYGDRNE